MTITTDLCYNAAELITDALSNRKGFEVIDEIDDELLHEIREEIASIIRDVIVSEEGL